MVTRNLNRFAGLKGFVDSIGNKAQFTNTSKFYDKVHLLEQTRKCANFHVTKTSMPVFIICHRKLSYVKLVRSFS